MAITRSGMASSGLVAMKKTERKRDKAHSQVKCRKRKRSAKKKQLPKWMNTIMKKELVGACDQERQYAMHYPRQYSWDVTKEKNRRAKKDAENVRLGRFDGGVWRKFLPFGSFKPTPSWLQPDWKEEYALLRKDRGDADVLDDFSDDDMRT